jgi:hypothetical protein
LSSTNRGGKRNESDFYASPPWTVDRFLEEMALPANEGLLPGGRWLEPGAGDGAIIRTVQAARPDVTWCSAELREETRSYLEPLVTSSYYGDFLEMSDTQFGSELFDVIITNPPYRLAYEFIAKSMRMARHTVMLLRLNFLGSEKRAAFMREFPPDIYTLPNRPMFSLNKEGKPGTDSPEYAWMVWGHLDDARRSYGRSGVLRTTPAEVRKAWAADLRMKAAQLSVQGSVPLLL